MRLIDADAIFPWYVEAFKGGVEPQIEPHDIRFSMNDIKMNLSNIPTIDAVEVVRCKDCRWGREVCGNIECRTDMNLPPEYHGYYWYCPNGERKEE